MLYSYLAEDQWIVFWFRFGFCLVCFVFVRSLSSWLAFHVAKTPLISVLCVSALFGFSPLCFGTVAVVARNNVGCPAILIQNVKHHERNAGILVHGSWLAERR